MKYEITHTEFGTNMVVNSDKLDSKVAPELKSQFITLISDPNSGGLMINLSSIQFADSSGLSALLLAYRLYRDANRNLVLYGVSERVNKLIEISQLSSVFNIAPDQETATALLK